MPFSSRFIKSAGLKLLRMISHRQKWEGIEICILTPVARKAHALKVQAALELILEVAPFRIRHIRRQTCFILVIPLGDRIAEWRGALRICALGEKYMEDPAVAPKHVAAAIIHEITHGRIDQAGILYEESNRAEIEAVCLREEIRFARRLRDGEDIIKSAERMMTRANEELSDASLQDRQRSMLKADGVPQWLTNRFFPVKWNSRERANDGESGKWGSV
jgi:hypothetical protein